MLPSGVAFSDLSIVTASFSGPNSEVISFELLDTVPASPPPENDEDGVDEDDGGLSVSCLIPVAIYTCTCCGCVALLG